MERYKIITAVRATQTYGVRATTDSYVDAMTLCEALREYSAKYYQNSHEDVIYAVKCGRDKVVLEGWTYTQYKP